MSITKDYYTPPQLGKIWGVSQQKVRLWIEAGELSAFNSGDKHRPRWRVSHEAAKAFEKSRSNQTPLPKRTRRSKPIKEFA